jgi:peroxiredoxin
MSQAEIAGGTVTPPNELPSKGRQLHDFELTSALGAHIQLSDYRGRSNLVLILADDQQPTMRKPRIHLGQ